MQTRVLFGTDGIRGVANVYPVTVEVALALGRALAYLVFQGKLGRPDKGHRRRIVIGKDTRLSGYCLEQAIAAGICSMGVDVMLVGPLPTPGIAFITGTMRADAGIVVSASHNAFDDNGIKIFDHQGFKLSDAIELELEHLILSKEIENVRPVGTDIGRAKRIDDAIGRYVVYAKSVLPNDQTLDNLKIVLDCAHGAAYRVAPSVFQELGAELSLLGIEPNGTNINKEVGSLYPQGVQKQVIQMGAHLGIALDGDADRVVIVDECGHVVPGEIVIALVAEFLHETGRLQQDTVVTTDMSNLALDRYLLSKGIQVERTKVGDRYVVESMRQKQYSFGGEESGHLVFFDHGTTGDGIVGALLLISLMLVRKKPLSELTKAFELLPRAVRNVRVTHKIPFKDLAATSKLMKSIQDELRDEGRLFVRYSGTENKARILVEGTEENRVNQMADELARMFLADISYTN